MPNNKISPEDGFHKGLVRLLAVAFSRYTKDPETRAVSSRHILAAAIRLHRAHVGEDAFWKTAGELLGGGVVR